MSVSPGVYTNYLHFHGIRAVGAEGQEHCILFFEGEMGLSNIVRQLSVFLCILET